MPRLELTDRELIVHLSFWEKLAAFHRSVRVPLAKVRGATEDAGFSGADMGLRLPGTSLPGVIAAGTYYNNRDKQFIFVTRKTQPVVIELADAGFARIVLGVANARTEAARINAALGKA
jgi:hypothetical protein